MSDVKTQDPSDFVCCSGCGARYRVRVEYSGRRVKCKKCEGEIHIPEIDIAPPYPVFKSGDRLGNYTITERIGKGGMGIVYKANHTQSGREVAIKSLTNGAGDRNSEQTRRFIREARLAAAISHPNVVQVIGFIQKNDYYHIIQEYVPHGSVKDLLIDNGTLSEKQSIEILVGVAKALIEAAQIRIVHRDIKPDNIMIDSNKTPKLADLGLATQTHELEGNTTMLNSEGISDLFNENLDASLTMSRVAMGTPAYMAPEQATDSRSVDARADIYSLGATMYHMLCGKPPFMANNLRKILSMHRHSPVPDPREERSDISDQTAEFIMKCLAKYPEERYQDAQTVLDILEKMQLQLAPPEEGEQSGKTVHFYEDEQLTLPPPEDITISTKIFSHVDTLCSRENLIFIILFLCAAIFMYGIYLYTEAQSPNKNTPPQKTAPQ